MLHSCAEMTEAMIDPIFMFAGILRALHQCMQTIHVEGEFQAAWR